MAKLVSYVLVSYYPYTVYLLIKRRKFSVWMDCNLSHWKFLSLSHWSFQYEWCNASCVALKVFCWIEQIVTFRNYH
jgi:hypothetical protein